MGRALKNRRRKGREIEKLAEVELKARCFITWRPPKVRFQPQDILGCFDLVAVNKKELKLIQVQKNRARPYKVKGLRFLPKPKRISYELWVWKEKEKKFHQQKLMKN